jgi:hypothetical protein
MSGAGGAVGGSSQSSNGVTVHPAESTKTVDAAESTKTVEEPNTHQPDFLDTVFGATDFKALFTDQVTCAVLVLAISATSILVCSSMAPVVLLLCIALCLALRYTHACGLSYQLELQIKREFNCTTDPLHWTGWITRGARLWYKYETSLRTDGEGPVDNRYKYYKKLVEMGFAGSTAEAALEVHSELELAIEWCLANPDGIAQPPKDEQKLTGTAGHKQQKTKKEKEHEVLVYF